MDTLSVLSPDVNCRPSRTNTRVNRNPERTPHPPPIPSGEAMAAVALQEFLKFLDVRQSVTEFLRHFLLRAVGGHTHRLVVVSTISFSSTFSSTSSMSSASSSSTLMKSSRYSSLNARMARRALRVSGKVVRKLLGRTPRWWNSSSSMAFISASLLK